MPFTKRGKSKQQVQRKALRATQQAERAQTEEARRQVSKQAAERVDTYWQLVERDLGGDDEATAILEQSEWDDLTRLRGRTPPYRSETGLTAIRRTASELRSKLADYQKITTAGSELFDAYRTFREVLHREQKGPALNAFLAVLNYDREVLITETTRRIQASLDGLLEAAEIDPENASKIFAQAVQLRWHTSRQARIYPTRYEWDWANLRLELPPDWNEQVARYVESPVYDDFDWPKEGLGPRGALSANAMKAIGEHDIATAKMFMARINIGEAHPGIYKTDVRHALGEPIRAMLYTMVYAPSIDPANALRQPLERDSA